MGEKHRDEARNRQSKLTTVACWLVLAAILLGILRFTSLGARTTPTLNVSASREATIRLWRPPGSPAHRLVAVGLGAADELFLLDTGAAETVISSAAAERAGLVESARTVLAALNDSFGLHALVRVDRLTLGARAYADFEALILDLSHLEGVLGVELAGVLGMNVLGQSPFEIDFVRDVLRIGGSLTAFRAATPKCCARTSRSSLSLRWPIPTRWVPRRPPPSRWASSAWSTCSVVTFPARRRISPSRSSIDSCRSLAAARETM